MASKHLHGCTPPPRHHMPGAQLTAEAANVRRLTKPRNSLAAGLDEQDSRSPHTKFISHREPSINHEITEISVSASKRACSKVSHTEVILRNARNKTKAVLPINQTPSTAPCTLHQSPHERPRLPWHQTHLQPPRFRQCACVPSLATAPSHGLFLMQPPMQE